MLKLSIKENLIKNLISILNQKNKYTSNLKGKNQLILIGSIWSQIIGLCKMLLELCGNIIQIQTRDN